MKRTLAVLLSLALVVGALAGTAEAGKKKKKKDTMTVEETYASPAWGVWLGGNGGGACGTGCVTFMPRVTDSIVSMVIEDAVGDNVAATVGQDLDGDNITDSSTEVCTKGENIPVTAGYEVIVFIWAGLCSNGSPSTPTTGTVTATFSG